MIPLVLAIKYQNKKCKCKRKIIVLPGEIVTIPEISYYSDDNSDDNSDNNSNNNSDNEIRSIIL
jgi:hypothetical protein